jgi:hypothetical protein
MSERFPEEVETVLTAGGWSPDRRVEEQADAAVRYVEEYFGNDDTRTESFPLAVDTLREFTGVCVIQDGAGLDLRRRSFLFDATKVAATSQTLTDFKNVIGSRLFPLGFEGDHDSILAVAETGHVFSLDHTGEWHLGDSIDDALVTLVTGKQPERVDDSGNW